MITLVTTTRDRPECFTLLEGWVRRQTMPFDQWLVINDGTAEYSYTMGQEVVNRKPRKRDIGISILDSWLTALPRIKGDKVIVLEDDDWYNRHYVAAMATALDEVELAGVRQDVYYKLPLRRFLRMQNREHASLAATAFRSSVLPQVERAVKVLCAANRSVFIDTYLWVEAGPVHGLTTRLMSNTGKDSLYLHVGFKQMPGAKGLGIGHNDDGSHDPALQLLRTWIGGNDTYTYQQFARKHWPPDGVRVLTAASGCHRLAVQ